jgi:hypothetical protein
MYFVRFKVLTQVSNSGFNILPCLEGSTERSDGSLGRSLRKMAMVAWDAVSGP